MRQIFCILISIIMTSCATFLNQPYKNVKVYTTESSQIIHGCDTIKTVNNKANVRAERKNENLSIVVITDSITKPIEIKPINSFAYWLNIYPTPLLWTGFLIDKDNPKRYSYPKRVYINSADTMSKYYRYSQSDNKGELHLHLSLPYINSFCLKPKNETYKINTGFWGFSIGLDYYHSNNQFVNLEISGVMDFFLPVLGAVDLSGECELMSSWYISMSNNHRLKRFTIGYGFSFGKNTWNFRYYDRWESPPPTREPVSKSHYALSLIFPAYYQLGRYFNIGIVYRPTFCRPNLIDAFAYEHLISFVFAWKIRIKR